MENDGVRKVVEEFAGKEICASCADTFLAILDRVRARRGSTEDATEDANN